MSPALDSIPIPFSILMAVYAMERPDYLAAALGSVRCQTRLPDQIVIVCDGPLTAELDRVLEQYTAVLPLTVVRQAENRGLSHALNAGLPHCSHEWIARFDSDDLCESTRFAEQVVFIAEHPAVDVFGANIMEFATDSAAPHAIRTVPQSHDAIVNAAKLRNPLNHVTVFFRKSVVEAAGGYPHRASNEDYALWVELMRRGCRFANMPRSLVRVRAGSEMVSRRGGLSYLRAEVRLQNHFRRTGFIGIGRYLFNVGVRIAIRLAPQWLRRRAYHTFLRRRPDVRNAKEE